MDSLPIHQHKAPPTAIATNAKMKQAKPWFLGMYVKMLFFTNVNNS